VDSGPEQPLPEGVITFAPGRKELYYMRQDANPPTIEGLGLYSFNFETRASRLIARPGFGLTQKNDPQRQRIMVIEGLR